MKSNDWGKLIIRLILVLAAAVLISGCSGGSADNTNENPSDPGGDNISVADDTEVDNAMPTADAGSDRNVATGSLVTLYGGDSMDPDGDLITYIWSIISRPEGSSAALSDSSAADPVFSADVDGEYVITLVVNDGRIDSEPSQVTITARNAVTGVLVSADAIRAVTEQGNYIYALTDDSILSVDISVPSAPVLLAATPITADAQYIDSWNNYVVTAAGKSGSSKAHIDFYDVSDPAGVVYVNSYELPEVTVGQHCVEYAIDPALNVCLEYEDTVRDISDVNDIAISNGVLYVLEDVNSDYSVLFTALDITDPSNIDVLSVNLAQSGGQWSSLKSIAIDNGRAYMADSYDMLLWVYDISNPENINGVSRYTDFADSEHPDVAVSGGHAYLVGDSKMHIFDTGAGDGYGNLSSPVTYAFDETSAGQRKVRVVKDCAYVTSEHGLQVLDIHDPDHTLSVASYDLNDALTDVLATQTHLVCTGEKGIYLIQFIELSENDHSDAAAR